MKNTILLFIACFILLPAFSQAPPQGINYQAVAVDAGGKEIVGIDVNGQPIQEKKISVQFSIIADSPNGTLVYREAHSTNTDEHGLFNLVIGFGTPNGGTGLFSDIDWGSGKYYLKVELDPDGGSAYKDMGTQQLLSVPYALYTKEAANGILSIVDNGDGTSNVTLSDGTVYTISSTTGPQGPAGPAGTTGATGPQGPAGADGNGIVSTTDNGDGTLTFTYTDGSTFTTPNLEGPTGPQGPAGTTGATGPQGPAGADGNGIVSTTDNGDGTLTFTYTDGSTFTTPNLEGPAGPQGPAGTTGATGPQGPAGTAGNGITATTDNGDGTFTFTYTDGSTFTTSNLQGPAGPQGPAGIAGATGPQGPAGTTGATGATGPQGPAGPAGTNGISITWLGTMAAAPGSPVLNNAYYNSTDGISYIWDGSGWQILAQDGTGSGGNTLDQAYDQGGPGAGRSITADSGPVTINASGAGAGNIGLLLNHTGTNTAGLGINFSGTGNAMQLLSSNSSNTFAAIQVSTNSLTTTNSAIFAQSTGAARAIAGQVESSSTADVAVRGLNLRTAGGVGVEGVGFNGVSGSSAYAGGFGIYGLNTGAATGSPGSLGVGTYGLGFNGVYGQTSDVTNGWAGYFTADLGVEGTGYSVGGWNTVSDLRLKSNIVPIESALDRLSLLRGTHYTITTPMTATDGTIIYQKRVQYGVIAQEVEAVFPEMVSEKPIFINSGDQTVYKTVEYTQLIPVLLEAIKELDTRVKTLESQVETLEGELQTLQQLQAQMQALQQQVNQLQQAGSEE